MACVGQIGRARQSWVQKGSVEGWGAGRVMPAPLRFSLAAGPNPAYGRPQPAWAFPIFPIATSVPAVMVMVMVVVAHMMVMMVVVIGVMVMMVVVPRELHIWVGSRFSPRPRCISGFDLPQQGESIRNRIEQIGI